MEIRRGLVRAAFTLVELLVVISVIGILAAILLPALGLARDRSRAAQCTSNLRQFGIGFSAYAQSHKTGFCSGNFDWLRDGAVTEVGWVADLVNRGVIVGAMNCPTNEGQVSESFEFLMQADTSTFSADTCVNRLGSLPKQLPDGSMLGNPCRDIVASGVGPGSEARRALVDERIFKKGFNTNYTASWFMVRGGVVLDASGNPKPAFSGCTNPPDLSNRTFCLGPLKQAFLDSSKAPAMLVPLLGDGAVSGITTSATLGGISNGMLVKSMTNGPRLRVHNGSEYPAPAFGPGTPRTGPTGWWKTWNRDVLQDYRNFAPLHRGSANILFADGSVRQIYDANDDGFLNNGFSAGGGFATDEQEITQEDIFSLYSLDALQQP